MLYDGYVESEHLGTKLDMEHMVLAVLALARLHAGSFIELVKEKELGEEKQKKIESEFDSLGSCIINRNISIIYIYLNGLLMLQKELEDRSA